MSILDLLNRLEENQVYITLNGEDLDVSFEQEEVSEEIINLIKGNKSELINYLQKIEGAGNYQTIPNVSKSDSYALSSSQSRLWVLSQFDEASLAYNLPVSVELDGKYNVVVLQKAIDAVIERHEILRTVFKPDENGEIKQWIIPNEDFKFESQVYDFSSFEDANEKAEAIIEEDSWSYFDLEKGPLFRVIFFKLTDEKYTFYYNMHHIISDGWSMKVLANDVLAYYEALENNASVAIAPLKIHYKDFAAWQQEQLDDQNVSEAKKYWLNTFKEYVPTLSLPTTKKRPVSKTYNGKKLKTYLSKATYQELKSFSKLQEGSLFNTLITIWNIVFHKYTQEDDFVIGTPSAGRLHSELENQIGFYVNTLALRNTISPEANFISTYQQIKENTAKAVQHQVYPFDALVENITLKRDTSRNALFDVMISLQNIIDRSEEVTRNDVLDITEIIDEGSCYSKFDIEINFSEEEGHLALQLDYNVDVYDVETIERLLVHFKTITKVLLASPEKRIGSLQLITAEDTAVINDEFNATYAAYNLEETVLDKFAAQVKATPELTAVEFDKVYYSYTELEELSNKFASFLIANYNVVVNDLVGLQLDRSERLPLAILAILKAGGTYVPLDTNYPEDRINYIKEDANLKVIITEAELSKFFNQLSDITVVELPKVSTLENAYCIYTSGSTGNPKGVINGHKGLMNRLLWMSDYLSISGGERYLQKTPYTFDVSVWEFLLPLTSGGTLVLAKPGGHKDPYYLKDIIKSKEINIMHFVPSMLSMFLNSLDDKEVFNSLKHVICSGEELLPRLVADFRDKLSGIKIHNLYGPTEAAIDVTAINVTNTDLEKGVSIGYPIANTKLYIVDEEMNMQPIGVPGELIISGVQVANGYLNLEELTAEKFISDPFEEGARAYKTGDIGYWQEDGSIQYLRRKDNQIKLRGNRIELGEIQTVLESHAFISQAAVAIKEVAGDAALAAYIVWNMGVEESKDGIKEYLSSKLPEYMIPNFYVTLTEIPLTTSGKTNTKALPEISNDDVLKKEYVAPVGEIEEQLVKIWEDLLQQENIGVTDDFFDLGGHSLKAGQLVNIYIKKVSVKLRLKEIFDARTIRQQAILIKEKSATDIGYQAIEKAPEMESYPLSDAQEMIWINSQSKEGMISFNVSKRYHFGRDFDVELLNRALEKLIERHEILRTVFKRNDAGDVRQWVVPTSQIYSRIEAEDISYSENPRDIVADFIYADEVGDLFQPFDFENGPLFRFKLFQAEEEYVLYSVFHHMITDGVTSEIIIKDFSTIYYALKSNVAIPLEPLEIQYKDFSFWQHNAVKSDSENEDKTYWLDRFNGKLGNLDLPSKRKRPKIKTSNGHYVGTFLSNKVTTSMYQYSNDNNGSLFITLLSIWNILFYKYTQKKEIIMGTSVAGRNHPDIENQLGCFINVLALLNEVDGDLTFNEFYEKVKESTFEAFEHQMYPFNNLIKELKIKKDISRNNQLYDVMFYLQNFEEIQKLAEDMTDEETEVIHDYGFRVSKLDIEVGFHENIKHLKFMLKYNKDVYDYEEMSGLIKHYKTLASNILENPDQKISELSMVGAKGTSEIITEFNDTETVFNTNESVVDLFKRQVNEQPNNTAIVFEGNELTYAELNTVSNQFATYLESEYKIQPNDFVGIQLERSELLPAAILSVLKLGAAYIPVETDFPEERVAYITKDAGLKLMVNADVISNFMKVKNTIATNDITTPITSERIAYAIYTSGTTGKPKGVPISHAALHNYVSYAQNSYVKTESTKTLLFTSISFDLTVTSLFVPLCFGGSIEVIPTKENPLEVLEIVSQKEYNFLKLTPSHMEALLDIYSKQESSVQQSLKTFIVGGESLKRETVTRMLAYFGEDTIVWNEYGPTEATVGCITQKITKENAEKPMSIGTPIANTNVYIVDEDMNLQPIGIPGELLISGVQVAKEYLNLPALTAEKFVTDPFVEGRKVYRTGDMAAWKPDGTINFLGRKDNQVKIRGNRIELEEIENAALGFSEVIQQAVVVAKQVNKDQSLVVYYTNKDDQKIDKKEIKTYLADKLPKYMVPSFYVLLESMPLTSNGKIDRKSLPDIIGDDIIKKEYIAPRNNTEKRLVDIWEEELNIERIGITDNFFDLGGDSIISIRLIGSINTVFNINLEVTKLFGADTIESLSKIVEEAITSVEIDQEELAEIDSEFDDLLTEVMTKN